MINKKIAKAKIKMQKKKRKPKKGEAPLRSVAS